MINQLSGDIKNNNLIVKDGREKLSRKLGLLLIIVSLLSTIIILFDSDMPAHYDILPLLPLAYVVLLLINYRNLNEVFSNFGVMLIVVLEFLRLVVSPLFLALGCYWEIAILNVEVNTPKAIGLLIYEVLIIALAIKLPVKMKERRSLTEKEYHSGIKRLHVLMAIYTAVLVVFCAVAPEILLAHRTFLGAFTDRSFTSMTFDSIIDKFPSGAKHYLLILSRFLLAPYRLLLPAYLIVVLHHYFKNRFKWLTWLLSFFPFFVVNDVIAQSVYFTMFLLLLNCYLYKVSYKAIIGIFIAAMLVVVIYFCGRYFISKSDGDSIFNDFSERLVKYFSGVNIVSGSFNQPADLDNKYQYCLYDFLTAIPFNKTLLGLDQSISSATLFNSSSSMYFQIPTTIGMCNYYFGPLLAPLYSFILTRCAKRSGEKLIKSDIPLMKVVYMFAAFILALGIVMYNIEIACNTLVQVVLPIYIVAKLAFRRNKIDT